MEVFHGMGDEPVFGDGSHPVLAIRWRLACAHTFGIWAAAGQPRSPGRSRGREPAGAKAARTFRLPPCDAVPYEVRTQHNSFFRQPSAQLASSQFPSLGPSDLARTVAFCDSSPIGAQRYSLVSVR